MEQKSNVQYRADKEYRNSREKFFLFTLDYLISHICCINLKK